MSLTAPGWPKTICGVVYHGVERGEKCQFSFACTDNRRSLEGSPGWEQSQWIADDVAARRAYLSELDGALHYHAVRVRPIWRLTMRPVRTIGQHIFYIDRTGGGVPRSVVAAPTVERRVRSVEGASPRASRGSAKSGDFVADTMDRMRQGAN